VLVAHVQELKLAEFGLVLSMVGIVVLLGARDLSVVAIALAWLEWGFSVFPVAIATLSRKVWLRERPRLLV